MKFFILFSAVFAQYEILGGQQFWKNLENEIKEGLNESMQFDDLKTEDHFHGILEAYQRDHPEKVSKISRRTGAVSLSPEDKLHMLKYLQLKYTIMALQKNRQIGKYCFYGCWCLPNGTGMTPFGEPVDEIDNSCKDYTKCYNCLYNPAPFRGMNCDEEEGIRTRYSIRGSKDENGKTVLFCRDPIGSCARSRCECDKALSEKLALHENEWTVENHHKWNFGDFNREEKCVARSSKSGEKLVEEDGLNGEPGIGSRRGFALSMIQSRTQRISQPALSVYGRISGCCGKAPFFRYFREGQRCCANGEIVDEFAPCSEEFLNL